MHINRNNYEEFFLLYADNELSGAEKQEVEKFAAAHPDLKAELDMLLQAVLPNEFQAVFMDKESLFRTSDTDSLVNMTNYEGYFVRYTDDELNNKEKAATEEFVYKHPECQAEFELIQQARLRPDTNIRFPDKKLLYRKTTEDRPVILLWMRFAAAAVIIILAGLFWFQQKQVTTASGKQEEIVQHEKPAPAPEVPIQQNDAPTLVENQSIAVTKPGPYAVEQPKKKSRLPQTNETAVTNELASNVNGQVKPIVDQKQVIDPAAVASIAVPEVPKVEAGQPAGIETKKLPEAVFASNTDREDYIFVDNTQPARKSPLRGLLRKASRYVEQKNPLSPEHKKGGVFTASQEQ